MQVVKSKKQRRITPKKVSDDVDSAHNDYFCDNFNKITEPQCSNKLEDLELQVPYKIINVLKWSTDSITNLTVVCRYRWSR